MVKGLFNRPPKIWQAAQGSGHRRGEALSDELDPEGVAGQAKFALYREALRTTGR